MEHTNEKLHPALRITLPAWLLTRLALYLCYFFKLGSLEAILFQLSYDIGNPVPSTFLLNGYRRFFDFMNVTYPTSGTWGAILFGEILMLGGTIGVYTYSRSYALPQVAERATWFWALSPLIFLTLPGIPWHLTIPLIAIAFGLTFRRLHFFATAAASLAIFISPEAILTAPLLIAEGWKSRDHGDETGPLVMTIALPSSFIFTVFFTILFGDGVKAFQGPAEWRQDWSWHAFTDFIKNPSLEWVALGLVFVAILLSFQLYRRLPKRTLLIIGTVLYPLLCTPSLYAIGTLALALPTFVAIAHVTQDPEMERPAIVVSLLTFMLIIFFT